MERTLTQLKNQGTGTYFLFGAEKDLLCGNCGHEFRFHVTADGQEMPCDDHNPSLAGHRLCGCRDFIPAKATIMGTLDDCIRECRELLAEAQFCGDLQAAMEREAARRSA